LSDLTKKGMLGKVLACKSNYFVIIISSDTRFNAFTNSSFSNFFYLDMYTIEF
jgi:hypothetical protein